MKKNSSEQSNILEKSEQLTPQLVMKMLKDEGQIVSISDAEAILEFLRKMANIAVSNYLNQNTLNTDQNR
ncbi:hypothetical protein FAM09_11015 [Niastella caeni]|uniref:DUF2624 family protein n=1 Tax=Niastella caeni TaxID=2569763 RepID=A0A4S8HZV6_9BACT|nr:hypothetical protein [Niastella caeni]THU40389.1 hypothetical protein FAM09_11015 [Niastella caeni]